LSPFVFQHFAKLQTLPLSIRLLTPPFVGGKAFESAKMGDFKVGVRPRCATGYQFPKARINLQALDYPAKIALVTWTFSRSGFKGEGKLFNTAAVLEKRKATRDATPNVISGINRECFDNAIGSGAAPNSVCRILRVSLLPAKLFRCLGPRRRHHKFRHRRGFVVEVHGAGTLNVRFTPKAAEITDPLAKGYSMYLAKVVENAPGRQLAEIESQERSTLGRGPSGKIRDWIAIGGSQGTEVMQASHCIFEDLLPAVSALTSPSKDRKEVTRTVEKALIYY
jgi:hypothetical protein